MTDMNPCPTCVEAIGNPDEAKVHKMDTALSEMKPEKFDSIIHLWVYQLWEKAGCPEGRSEEFWLRAEKDMRVARMLAAHNLKALYWQYKYEDLFKVMADVPQLDYDQFKERLLATAK